MPTPTETSRAAKRAFRSVPPATSSTPAPTGWDPVCTASFDRKAGELSDFRYSPALKRSGIVWSPQTLESYLTDPQALVPGNRMPYAGMKDPSDRADLIAYLSKASK